MKATCFPVKAPMVRYMSTKEVPALVIFSNINTFIYRITAPQRYIHVNVRVYTIASSSGVQMSSLTIIALVWRRAGDEAIYTKPPPVTG